MSATPDTPRSWRAAAILWAVLTPSHQRRFAVLQVVSVLMAMSTVVGLAAVMTYLAVLANPALIETHPLLSWLSRLLHITRPEFLVVLGGGFIGLLLLSTAVNIGGSRAMGRFAYSVGDRIREVLFAEYLQRDYLFHARARAARLMDNVLFQADRTTQTLLSAQLLLTNAALTLLVIASIAWVNPAVAVGGVLTIVVVYLLFYGSIRRRVGRNGRQQSQLGAERIAVVEESLVGVKYLLLARAQVYFRRRFDTATRALSRSLADTQFIAQSPKYFLECVAGAALIACAGLANGGSTGGAWLAQLSFIGFAGFRLLPAFQQMYYAFVIVRANRSAIESLAFELTGSHRNDAVCTPPHLFDQPAFRGGVELSSVSFRYSPATPLLLDNASLRFDSGAAIGIVGASGCGKTTLVDLVLGLLMPTDGHIAVDGELLDERRIPAWQRSVGYVPQDVMILNASVRENIAFGVDPTGIDDARVRAVACQAGASEFIEALPGGYAAEIAGAGGGLSGGQRQRIGIARALYGNPSLLVFDEATNALDVESERAIIETVIRNRGTRTLLIVAHGAAVIDACDRVYVLRDGVLSERGPRAARLRRVAE